MDAIDLANTFIIATVVLFAFVAIREPKKRNKENSIKAALMYLVIFAMLTGILLTCRCEREQKKHEPKEIRQ